MNKNTRKFRALPWARRILAFQAVVLIFCLASCSPKIHKSITKQLTPLDSTEKVTFFDINEVVPDNAEVIGEVMIMDGGFSSNCDWETILEKAKSIVRSAGGNGLEILQHSYPGQNGSSCHQIYAYILNISDDIKPAELSETAQQYFHDYVLLEKNDTIPCRIVDETANYISFIYERQGIARSAKLPKDKIIAYHIDDPKALSELQQQREKDKLIVRFGLEGGYAFRTARFANGLTNDYKDYLRKLMRGPVFGANAQLIINKKYSVGLHYDRFMSSNSGYFYGYDNNGNYLHGIVSDNHTINFFAVSFGYYACSRSQKHRFCSEYMVGYMNYVDKGVEFGDSYTINGATAGMGFVFDYDYMLAKHVGIGAGISYYNGVLSKAKSMALNIIWGIVRKVCNGSISKLVSDFIYKPS